MDFVREQLSNIDNHHYLTIVFGKHNENNFEANIGKEKFVDLYNQFINNEKIKNDTITTDVYRDYINNGVTYRCRNNGVNCFSEDTVECEFTDINGKNAYIFLTENTDHQIDHFPIDKEMDDIKEKSEIIINIDNLFNVVFLTYNDQIYYYKIVIQKYNIYGDKLISRLEEIINQLS